MQILERLKPWMGRKSVRGALLIVFILFVLAIITNGKTETLEPETRQKPTVSLTSSAEYSGKQSLSLIGTVRAMSEASVTSERGGRVTSVPVKLGQFVQAGQVIATLENASEAAAVLQAEGAYDAAVVASLQSTVGVDEAEDRLTSAQNAAVTNYYSAYNTVNGAIRNSVDTFFSDPDGRVPGLRLDGRGLTEEMNHERVAYQTILPEWQAKASSLSGADDLVTELARAKQIVQRTVTFLDSFISLFEQQEDNNRYTEAEVQGYIASFTTLRSTLLGVQTSIDTSISSLNAAEDALKRAELNAVGGTNSIADAQVKQALGVLRSAQANYAKTILRTPVSGTVNSLSVRTGDFINAFSLVARVANNDVLEIVTFISDDERSLLSVGDEVVIENTLSGTVTEISPAVNTTTGKTEVRITTVGTDIVNGDTVRISKELTDTPLTDQAVKIPLSAVKFEAEDGFVLTVESNRLVKKPVTLGFVRGGTVEVTEGLESDDLFVIDARGLQPDTEVTVSQ